jgi:membrane fusion protein (multidrug efflux system)
MKKRMSIMLLCVGILFGLIFLYKMIGLIMFKKYMAKFKSPAVTISATKATYEQWSPELKITGSMRAIRGVNVTTELGGMVQKIYFMPGASVNEGDELVQLNADTDVALLQSLQALAELANTTYNRDKEQFKAQGISKATLDTDAADLKNKLAQVAQQAATVAKKTLRAPFTGRLGISQVNPGQYLNPGDQVVTLQSLDPIYADFFVPQQALLKLKIGQSVQIAVDTFPQHVFSGTITTINPLVDTNTRNVEVEATISNANKELLPGMFAKVTVTTGTPEPFLTLPQAAISYNPYGDVVYIISESGKDENGKPILVANQRFVTLGDARGDQVAIKAGIKPNELVVTAGQMKLKNGSHVIINNEVTPDNLEHPNAANY